MLEVRGSTLIHGPNLPGKTFTITSVRNLGMPEWHLTMNGQTVTIRDGESKDSGGHAQREWLLVLALWRKQCKDCGCATCLEELIGG